MSVAIYIRVNLKKEFYDIDTSDFLFKIIQEGCSRRIAMTIVPPDCIVCKSDECVLSLSDSFNFQLVNPLIGNDCDYEITKYHPKPLHVRLLNLQELFLFILKDDRVKKIEVFFTLNYDIEGLETVNILLDDFALKFEPIIVNNCWPELYYRFIWNK